MFTKMEQTEENGRMLVIAPICLRAVVNISRQPVSKLHSTSSIHQSISPSTHPASQAVGTTASYYLTQNDVLSSDLGKNRDHPRSWTWVFLDKFHWKYQNIFN